MHRPVLLIAVVLSLVASSSASADRLEDELDTVWEATWDERGTPQMLKRWEQPIRYRFSGADAKRHREFVLSALTAASQAAGVTVGEATADETPNLEIDIGDHASLPDSVGCATLVEPRPDFAIARVRLRLRGQVAWKCAHHEVMHAMGVVGHPSGRTVLSYFPPRTDTLMDLDRLMLAAWHDPKLLRGASPFEILWTAALRVVQQPGLGIEAAQAMQRRQAYFDKRIDEMKAFASGQGDVPTIIKRSGRASSTHIDDARVLMAHYLGRTHHLGVGVARSREQALRWYRHAAQRAHGPSQFLLALVLGDGSTADMVEAHRWMATAARAGNTSAIQRLAQIEGRMDAESVAKAQALGPYAPTPAPAAR